MQSTLPTKPSHDLDACFQRTCQDRRSLVAVRNLATGQSLTFADLHEQYNAILRALGQLRIGPGAPVVTRIGNHPVFFSLLAACMSAGTALVALGEATDQEAAAVADSCQAAAIVTDRPLPIAALDRMTIGDGIQIAALRPARRPEVYSESAVLKLTSGSTDLPKAALASVHHLVNDGRHVIQAMGIREDDINFACIPLSHSYALGNIVMPLLLQGTAVALRQSFNPLQFADDLRSSGATVFPGVPFMFHRFRTLELDVLPASLRLLITAGARIDTATVRWAHERLGRKLHSFYGSSETGGISYDDTEQVDEPLHVGRPMPEVTIEIRDPDAAGAGRIYVAGTAVAPAYAGDTPVDVDTGFTDGGFVTSDIGYIDGRGRLVMTGRVSPLVNVAGRKVDPAEVERVLVDLPGVVDARVIGTACDRRGQQLVAFVVSDAGLTSVAVRRQCAKLLSPHKIPRRFIFLDQLPTDARGKIDRRVLEALAAEAGPDSPW